MADKRKNVCEQAARRRNLQILRPRRRPAKRHRPVGKTVEQVPEENNRKRPRNRARKTQEKLRQGRKAVRQDKRMRHDYRRNRDGRRRHLRRTPGHTRTGIQTLVGIRVDKIAGRPRRATHAREEVKIIFFPLLAICDIFIFLFSKS